jgi:hypothetical protein
MQRARGPGQAFGAVMNKRNVPAVTGSRAGRRHQCDQGLTLVPLDPRRMEGSGGPKRRHTLGARQR